MLASDSVSFAKRVLIATIVVLAVLLVLYICYLARVPLVWIGISVFLAVAINPIVHYVARFMPKRSLTLATLLVLVAIIAGLTVILWLFLAPLVDQTVKLASSLPSQADKAVSNLANTSLGHTLNLNQDSFSDFIKNNTAKLAGSVSTIGRILASIAVSIIEAIVAMVAITSLIFFMTTEEQRWKRVAMSLVPTEHKHRVARVGHQVYHIINGYVVGNLILSLIFGVSSVFVLWVTGSPYFLTLGLAVGLIDLIPLVGSTIGAILVGLICAISGQYWTAAIFAIYTTLYVQLENNVLNPAVYSKNVDISPLIVLVSILIGGVVAGILGALLAIPVAATIQVIAKELLTPTPAPKRR